MKAITTFLLALISFCVHAQWSTNPSVNNAVCNFAGSQTFVQVTSDGADGAICTWVDTRNGSQDIYAQRINATGVLQWTADAVAICNAASDQYSPKLIPDGSGGAIITWYDNRNGNYDIFAQRVNASGAVQWTTDGVAICTIAGNQNAQQLISDAAGGAIIAWSDGRVGGPNADIYAQRVNDAGSVLWTDGGAAVSTANSLQNIPGLVSDGAGGAIIAWEDWRNFSQTDIYAQRISFNGFTNWAFNGVPICTEPNFAHQYNTRIVSDGSGGAIMCWLDNRNSSTNTDIYAQKINTSGVTQWLNNGIAVCTAGFIQFSQQVITDGAGGAIIAWEDRRTERDIYAQRINGSGTVQWTVNGNIVCNTAGIQEEPQLAAATGGSAIVLWTDSRNGSQDIYVQSINAAGAASWVAGGVAVANESQSQSAAQLICGATGDAIIAWQDTRTTLDYDIYSSKILANGTLPLRLTSFSAVSHHDNVLLNWETTNEINCSHFDVEFSVNGTSFTSLGSVAAKNSPATNQYTFTHFSPAGNVLFYRLKQVDIDGKFEYSKTVRIARERMLQPILYPNPAADIIQLKNIKADEIRKIQIISSEGKTMMIYKMGNWLQYNISHLAAGIYTLKLLKTNGQALILKFKKE